jgi:hypothetical protein
MRLTFTRHQVRVLPPEANSPAQASGDLWPNELFVAPIDLVRLAPRLALENS